jgi:hypothetical protein
MTDFVVGQGRACKMRARGRARALYCELGLVCGLGAWTVGLAQKPGPHGLGLVCGLGAWTVGYAQKLGPRGLGLLVYAVKASILSKLLGLRLLCGESGQNM